MQWKRVKIRLASQWFALALLWSILIKVSLRFLIVHVKRIDHVFCVTARKMTLFRYSLPFPTSTSLLAYIQPKTRISRLIGAAQGRAPNCSKISERKRDLKCPDRILYLEYSNHKVSWLDFYCKDSFRPKTFVFSRALQSCIWSTMVLRNLISRKNSNPGIFWSFFLRFFLDFGIIFRRLFNVLCYFLNFSNKYDI